MVSRTEYPVQPKSHYSDRLLAAVVTFGVFGCSTSKTSVIPVASNEVRVSVDVDRRCGSTGAQELAVDEAAIATLKRGYDRFYVAELGESSVPIGVMTSPSMTEIHGNTMISSPSFSGIARRHHLNINVLMLKHDDEHADQAVDARAHLGPDWRKKVEDGVSC